MHSVDPKFRVNRNSNAKVTLIEVTTPGCTVRYQLIGSTAVQSGPITGNLHEIEHFHDAVAQLPFVQAVDRGESNND